MPGKNEDEVVLLVGGNPLPNYVAADALRRARGIARAHLIYTDQVKGIKSNLEECLKQKGFECRESFIENAGNVDSIKKACKDISPGSHLHYTGGTNTMAVHIYAAWQEKEGNSGQASYLYGRDDCLRTDAGTLIDMSAVNLDLETLATLHGLENCTPRKVLDGGPRIPEDAQAIAIQALNDLALAEKLYKAAKEERTFKKKPLNLSEYGLALSIPVVPGEGWDEDRITVWRKFIRSDWFEEWVALQVQATGVDINHLHVGIRPYIEGRDFELDVVVIRGHHLYVLSCTLENLNRSVCKSKLFEVAIRARQLGGDLARSALVCLAERDEDGKDIVSDLRKDIRTVSEALREPAVFGLEHVRDWLGVGGARPDLSELKIWLVS